MGRGVDFLSDQPNRLRPRVYDRVCPSYLPQMRAITRQSMAVTSDGRIVFINGGVNRSTVSARGA